MDKKTIAVIFGGMSGEHEVSCSSVINVAENIDEEHFDVLLIGITKDGRWLYVESAEQIKDGTWYESGISAELSPDAEKKCVIMTSPDGEVEDVFIDAAWPVLHGKYGEDGTIQGLFELARIPYVGCGVFSSAASMDKLFTKVIVAAAGIRQALYVAVSAAETKDDTGLNSAADRVEEELSYPVFVKPSRAGSSCGVSKAADRKGLIDALKTAAAVDSKILCEEFIKGREIECAVMKCGQEETAVSGVGEILSAYEFYDYDAKYNNPDSETVTDPDLPEETVEEIRKSAGKIFEALDCYGLSRVDFFVKDDGEVVFNEINTMPGFTCISMYPMLWEARGISKRKLVEKLIASAFERPE